MHRPFVRRTLFPIALLAVGCDTAPAIHYNSHPGRRWSEGCPAGERCSDLTPDGLRVRSLATTRQPPYLTAVQGTQSFQVLWPDEQPFDLDFVAEGGDAILSVVEVDSDRGSFTIRGDDTGGALIQLRDPAGLLYDQIWLAAKPVGGAFALRGWWPIIYAPSHLEVDIDLTSIDSDDSFFGHREYVVDESLALTPDPDLAALAAIVPLDWNHFRLDAETAGNGNLEVVAGGQRFDLGFVLVDTIDGIGPEPGEITLVRGEVRRFCAYGLSEEWPVIGIDFIYEITGPVEFRPSDPGCTGLLLVDDGPASLSASFADFSQSWSVVERQ